MLRLLPHICSAFDSGRNNNLSFFLIKRHVNWDWKTRVIICYPHFLNALVDGCHYYIVLIFANLKWCCWCHLLWLHYSPLSLQPGLGLPCCIVSFKNLEYFNTLSVQKWRSYCWSCISLTWDIFTINIISINTHGSFFFLFLEKVCGHLCREADFKRFS